MGHDVRDNPTQVFTVTNFSEDLDLDCSGSAALTISGSIVALANTLGTLINELQKTGVVKGTTA